MNTPPTQTLDTEQSTSTPQDASGILGRAPISSGRYRRQKLIGAGSSGEVWRAWDAEMEREVAIKVLRRRRAENHSAVKRFWTESSICGQLSSHPGVVSVFDRGHLPDGRPFIVMPVVEGKTLRAAFKEGRSRPPTQRLSTLHQLVGYLHGASKAIAYAHAQGVIHRDIKPSNIMVGAYGGVVLLDWGLATRQGLLEVGSPLSASVPTDKTLDGRVKGTACYMSPEQARGLNSSLDERSDIFALGAILHEILLGHPPWGWLPEQALDNARNARRQHIEPHATIPEALRDICERAIREEPERRYGSAGEFSQALASWLDRQDDVIRAEQLVGRAAALLGMAQRKRTEATQDEHRAATDLADLPDFAPETTKHAAWAMQDRAKSLRREADLHEAERIQTLHNALSFDPHQQEAHAQLAEQYYQKHRLAEEQRDTVAADRFEMLLREHDRGQYTQYLRPEGWLTLVTDPPARVTLLGFVEKHRRLTPISIDAPQQTPIRRLCLPIGSYLAILQAPGRSTIHYPFSIQRDRHTNGSLGEQPHVCRLPQAPGPDGMVFVAGGPFWSGGDQEAIGSVLPRRRLWVDDFWIDRFPVTNRDFLVFLNDLIRRGERERALALCPRERGTPFGRSIYGHDDGGAFTLVADPDGDIWHPDWPVVMLTAEAMLAYAEWRGRGTPWTFRLPFELEWEKAARGGDLRACVWGTDAFDPTWCRNMRSAPVVSLVPVYEHPVDESPYGVRGMAGGVSDICADGYRRDGPHVADCGRWQPEPVHGGVYTVRGGHWNGSAQRARLCSRGGASGTSRSALHGFRLVVAQPTAQNPDPAAALTLGE